jgi:hypothetical protein
MKSHAQIQLKSRGDAVIMVESGASGNGDAHISPTVA